MKVKELIDKLKDLEQDKEVKLLIGVYENIFYTREIVDSVGFVSDRKEYVCIEAML